MPIRDFWICTATKILNSFGLNRPSNARLLKVIRIIWCGEEKLQQGQETLYSYYRVSIVRKDGAIRHLEVFRKEVLWNDRQQYQLLHNDITERVRVEEAWKLSERNFRNSMDSSLMGIRIMGDADYTLYANQALSDMFGYRKYR